MNIYSKLLLFLLVIFCVIGCTNNREEKQGTITYSIDFPDFDYDAHPLMSVMLPKQQEFVFKNNTFKSQVKKAMVELNLFVDTDMKHLISELKFNKQIRFKMDSENMHKVRESMPVFNIKHTGKTDTIAGFNVKQAFAENKDIGTIELWYTHEIGISNPNWYNAFHELDGFLLDYTIIQSGIKMHLRAINYDPTIDEAEIIPAEFESENVSYQEFEKAMKDLFENLIN